MAKTIAPVHTPGGEAYHIRNDCSDTQYVLRHPDRVDGPGRKSLCTTCFTSLAKEFGKRSPSR